MKKYIAIVLGACMALSLAACGTPAPANSSPTAVPASTAAASPSPVGSSAQIPNPFQDSQTIADAAKLAGFTMTVPAQMPAGYTQSMIQVVSNNMIQVGYQNGDNAILLRKAKGNDDISGDYNEYKETNKLTIGKVEVTTRGDAGKVNVATWVDGEYTYSITGEGLDKTAISDMVSGIH